MAGSLLLSFFHPLLSITVVLHGACPQFSPSASPLSFSLPPSLPFSLSPVQHPGLKILRSDSSSSISSRIGWVLLSLLHFHPLLPACPICFSQLLVLLLLESFPDFFSFLFFLCVVFFLFPFFFLQLFLFWFVGLVFLLCLADCHHLTNVMSPHSFFPSCLLNLPRLSPLTPPLKS